MQQLQFTITEPIPCLNTMYRTNKYNRIYKSTKAKTFCEYFKLNHQQENLIDGKIKLSITFYSNRDFDIDGKLKCLLDAMNEVIYKDDNQIYELNIKKVLVSKKADIKTDIDIIQL